MKIRDILAKRERGISLEFFPPRNAGGKEGFMKVVNELRRYDPLFVSVTCSPGNLAHERTVDAITWMRQETDLTVMPHPTCIGATRESIDMVLRKYIKNGIDNILALRGDPPENVPDFHSETGEFAYAKDLVAFAGTYDAFSIGVAAYPEGHPQSPNLEKDIEYTKMKVDAGADFAIAQMFFDNRYFYEYLERARKAGITIPILPGILTVTDCRKIEEFSDFCSATIPPALKEKMYPVPDKPEEMTKINLEYALKQCEDLRANGVTYLHFYTMNKSGIVSRIIDALGMGK
ncbi:MAG: methylenetetrahydrofolate reductase [NAD(P)H] [Nitrospirae bacterium]|nr:methylenetetrahydrofolate reductase [NAD(P)H] [Nitrospirota bacterium]